MCMVWCMVWCYGGSGVCMIWCMLWCCGGSGGIWSGVMVVVVYV